MRRPLGFHLVAAVAAVAVALFAAPAAAGKPSHHHKSKGEPKLPVVFVHGGSGSASQYETQALRWASNDYPYRVRAIDRPAGQDINPILDDFIDDVRAETGEPKIYLVAHSIGVPIMSNYLNSSPDRAARVAKYVGIDGAGSTPGSCPGGVDEDGDWIVPCAGVFGRGNPDRGFGPDHNVQFEDQGHTEVVGSPESFEAQYEWLTGREPKTTRILAEPPGKVNVSGRALNFPANTALVGAEVELWEVRDSTGERKSRRPEAVFEIDETGNFGPVKVNGRKHYEIAMTRDGFVQHFYFEPWVRDNHLLRLLISPPDSALSQAVDRGPNHSSVVIERSKEFWGDNPFGPVDVVDVSTETASGPAQPPINLVNPATASFTENFVLALVTWDEGSDGVTDTSAQLPVNTFLSTIDVFYPAADPPDGVITVDMLARGEDTRQVLNASNWPSAGHGITFKFRDWVQDRHHWRGCKRTRHWSCR
jgi:pimeloyl-ACP methyl ester carboxylesterase